MVTRKNFDRIAWMVTAVMAAVTVLFMNGKSLGLESVAPKNGYEARLFDTSRVHTIDIVMDDWDSFIENAQSEEYALANVVIDGELIKNVGIRGKGNTSLSSVSSMGSQRYSLKIEFDQYDNNKSYYGLDKLALNNMIQDTTMMKDYLTYTMMNAFGVDSPLCSYVYVTVNGEDWGLYLAVEGVEDAFMERNYGAERGNLYKPDSMSFGGGRGNGRDFNMSDFWNKNFASSSDESEEGAESQTPGETAVPDASAGGFPQMGGFDGGGFPQMGGFDGGGFPQMGGFDGGGFPQMGGFGGGDSESSGGSAGGFPQMGDFGGADFPQMGDFSGGMPQMGNFPQMGDFTGGMEGMPLIPDGEVPEAAEESGDESQTRSRRSGGFAFGGMGMGSSDVKLQYIDDDLDSYSNIWNNAKTDISTNDKRRLVNSLKTLSSYEDIESVVDIDEVIRYFVVHNFVCNGDSYTGNMIHNYYLREKDGQLSMIPWDYNLAFGTFQGSNAQGTINTPIDMAYSDRPMVNWIFEDEEYTKLYHQMFAEFLETVDITAIIDEAYALIKPYVEKDPTKFYTVENFESGVETLRKFCELRSESITLQLENGDTTNTQNWVDASDLNLSEMGSMGGGGGRGGFGGGFGGGRRDNRSSGEETAPAKDNSEEAAATDFSGMVARGENSGSSTFPDFSGMTPPGGNGGEFSAPDFSGMMPPAQEGSSSEGNAAPVTENGTFECEGSECGTEETSTTQPSSGADSGESRQVPSGTGGMTRPDNMSFGSGGMTPPDNMSFGPGQFSRGIDMKQTWILLGVSAVIAAVGFVIAKKFRL